MARDKDITFLIKSLQTLKEYFSNNPAVCDDLQYMKMLVVALEKENKQLRKDKLTLRKELIRKVRK